MPTLPFEKLPASRPNPRILIRQQFDQAFRQLDTEWENKYRDLTRKYDWSRQQRDPDEIGRIRGMLRSQIENKKQQLQVQLKQQTDQFNLVDRLLDPAQAEQVKWRMLAGPEIAGRMFPIPAKPKDPRTEYHANLRIRTQLMNDIASYQLDSKGRLYTVDPDTGKLDKKLPASEIEYQDWMQSISALESAKIYRREQILPNLTATDIASTRLQELMLEQQEKSWREKFEKTMWKVMKYIPGYPMAMARGRELFITPETPGTFADKVSVTMTPPVTEPVVREPTEKITRKQLLAEYRRLGGGQTTEGRAFADKYLR